MASDAPLAWRMRHQLGAVLFYVAVVTSLLGAWTILYSIVVGPLDGLMVGIPLTVGSLIVMVGWKRRRARA